MITHNLPVQTTPFIGRTDELAEMTRLLNEPACRLLTLVGPGGIGKTRLALAAVTKVINTEDRGIPNEAPANAAPYFPHGVYFVPLQPLTAANSIPYAIAQAVGFQFFPGGEPRQQLIDYLRSKALLLILDNFEHLLDGVAFVADLLMNAPTIKLLTTSRETLNLQEEWLYRIAGMSVPQSEMDSELESYAAVQLFVECARRAAPDFSLEAARQSVVRICKLVEGMPLALEMTAAWLKRLPCHQIAQQIEHGLDFLEDPSRNVPARHRTMRTVFEHSWNLLTAVERDVLKKLSVFRGGFWLASAEAVAGASLGSLSTLVDKSLLHVNAAGRYHMHELLRQYAEEKLNTLASDSAAVRDLHCTYYADFMEQQWAHLKTGQQKSALDMIEVELENVLVAWHYAVKEGKIAVIGKAAYSLSFFLYWRYRYPEAVTLLTQAIETLRGGACEPETVAVLGHLMARLSWFQSAGGLAEKGKEMAQKALAALRECEKPEYLIGAIHSLALAVLFLEQFRALEQVAQEGLTAARNTDEQWWAAWFLYWLGHAARGQGSYREAMRFAGAALDITEELGELWLGACTATFVLSDSAIHLGNYSEAERFLQRGSHLFEEFGQLWGIAESYSFLGDLALAKREFADARSHYQRRLKMYVNGGQQPHKTVESLFPFAALLAAQDKQNKKEKAIELLAFIQQYPHNLISTQLQVENLLADLQPGVLEEVFTAAIERGRQLELDSIITNCLSTTEVTQTRRDLGPALEECLSDRELEILRLIADGLSNREIAEQRFLALSTVKWYVREIYSKLHVASRTQAVAYARQMKLLN